MKEYIERELALQLLEEEMSKTANFTDYEIMKQTYLLAKNHAKDWVSLIPAADVQKVKRGEWITTGNELKNTTCSVCGHWVETPYGKTTYCPSCGAKMDGKGDA